MTPAPRSSDRNRVVWIIALALVAVAGVVAVIATRGSKSEVSGEVRSQQTADVRVGASVAPGDGSSTTGPGAAAANLLPAFSGVAPDPALGQIVPTVSGTTLDGKPLTIGAGDGAKVVLFVAHWCPHCQREMPLLVEHLKSTPMPGDVALLAVSTSVAEDRGNYPPSAWLDRVGWKAPVLADSADGAAANAYGLRSFPYFVAVDARGKVVARTSGEISMDSFDALVEAARTGRALS